MKFSFNLGSLFSKLSLPEGIRASAGAGVDAVECHFPLDMETDAVSTALQETGLSMLGLNAGSGERKKGDFSLAAL